MLSTLLKLVIASRTFGTNDVHYWADFVEGVDRFGPIGIYGQQYDAVYNHPPLVGWALAAANWLVSRGMDLTFLTRVPASVADVGTAVLLFEVLRRRIPAHEAGAAAVLFALSPLIAPGASSRTPSGARATG